MPVKLNQRLKRRRGLVLIQEETKPLQNKSDEDEQKMVGKTEQIEDEEKKVGNEL